MSYWSRGHVIQEKGACLTFTPGEGVVPAARGPVLAGEQGVAGERVPGVAVEGDGLAHVVAGPHHLPVPKRLRVRTLLQLIG